MRALKCVVGLAMAGTIAACGGGGGGGSDGDSNAPTTAAGLWKGLTSNGRQVSVLTFQDGSAWALYSQPGGGFGGVAASVSGAVQGSLNGAATDFWISHHLISPGTLSATVTPRQSISGTLSTPGQSFTFDAAYDPAFEQSPNMAAMAGVFTGNFAVRPGGAGSTLAVSSTGAINGTTIDGCAYTGTGTPRTDGNALDVSITFGGGTCALGTSTVTGVAYYDSAARTLLLATLNSARDNGFLFVGDKD